MASVASDIDPATEPQVAVEEFSNAGGSKGEAPPEAAAAEVVAEKEAAEGDTKVEEKEEGQCGLCLYMEAGGCKEAFVSWGQCLEAADKDGSDMVQRCADAIVNLKKCLDAHADYYDPVLRAGQNVSDQAEAAIAADADKNKVEESAPSPATDETKKEEGVVEPVASAADGKEVVEQSVSSTGAEEAKKEAAVVEKVE